MKKLLGLLFFFISLHALILPKHFEANFTQIIFNQNTKLTYKGKFFYQNGKILWKYTYPVTKYIWITNQVYIYEPNLYQVTISPKPKLTIQNIINHAKKLKNDLYFTKIDKTKIYFKYKNHLGNTIEIKFFNQKTIPLNKKLFIIKFPKDVDIVYER